MIRQDEVHLFQTRLDLPKDQIERFWDILCASEKQRADRFYFSRHRENFIAAHGVLRTILCCYTGVAPEELRFGCDAKGKPELKNPGRSTKIRFNLSHSHGAALYGICLDHPIGVDIEHVRPLSNMESIAGRFFSENEASIIREFPQNRRLELFYQYWTMKEAYLKATGMGLSGLRLIEIPCPNPGLHHQRFEHLDALGKSWSIYPLSVLPGYAAALAVQGEASVLPCRQWSGTSEK